MKDRCIFTCTRVNFGIVKGIKPTEALIESSLRLQAEPVSVVVFLVSFQFGDIDAEVLLTQLHSLTYICLIKFVEILG